MFTTTFEIYTIYALKTHTQCHQPCVPTNYGLFKVTHCERHSLFLRLNDLKTPLYLRRYTYIPKHISTYVCINKYVERTGISSSLSTI